MAADREDARGVRHSARTAAFTVLLLVVVGFAAAALFRGLADAERVAAAAGGGAAPPYSHRVAFSAVAVGEGAPGPLFDLLAGPAGGSGGPSGGASDPPPGGPVMSGRGRCGGLAFFHAAIPPPAPASAPLATP